MCEVQPSAGTGSRPGTAAMEPHRWLPLEANPDVSARLGGGGGIAGCAGASAGLCAGLLEGRRKEGRTAEGRGPRAAPGVASRAEGWLVGTWN